MLPLSCGIRHRGSSIYGCTKGCGLSRVFRVGFYCRWFPLQNFGNAGGWRTRIPGGTARKNHRFRTPSARRSGSAGWFGYRGYSRRVQRTTGAKKRRIQMRVSLLAMALTLTASPAVNDVASSPTAAVRADGTVVDHKSEPTYIEERVKVIGDRTELKGLIGKDGIARKYDSSTGRYFVEFPEWLGARPSASADVPRPGPAVVNYDIHPVDLELVPILSMHAARKQRDRRREQEREREEEEPKDEL